MKILSIYTYKSNSEGIGLCTGEAKLHHAKVIVFYIVPLAVPQNYVGF